MINRVFGLLKDGDSTLTLRNFLVRGGVIECTTVLGDPVLSGAESSLA